MTHFSRRASRPAPRSSRRRTALISALVLGLVGLVPTAATADDGGTISVRSSSQCASGHFCLWTGTGYTGSFWSTGSTGLQNTGQSVSLSLWNRTNVAMRVYNGTSAGGVWVCYASGAIVSSTSVGSASVRTMTSSTC